MKKATAKPAAPTPADPPDPLDLFRVHLAGFLAAYYPRARDAALVIEFGGKVPPVLLPVLGILPSVLAEEMWETYSGDRYHLPRGGVPPADRGDARRDG